jgi:hypothetical protein
MAASMTKAERAELAEAEARLKKWRLQKLAAMDNPALLMKKPKPKRPQRPLRDPLVTMRRPRRYFFS